MTTLQIPSLRSRTPLLALLGLLSACGSGQEAPSKIETPTTQAPSNSPLLPSASTPADANLPEELQIARGLPELGFVPIHSGLPTSGSWRGYPDLIDFDGDGRGELVVSNREEDGWNLWTFVPGETTFAEGTWERRVEGLPRNLMYGAQDGIDVDHDGDLDLLLCSHYSGLRVYRNDGSANWYEEGPIAETKTLILDVCGLDLNGDEYRDAVGIGQFKGGLNLYLGNAEGGFDLHPYSRRLMGFERKAFGMQVEAGDFDGDGDDDIAAAAVNGVRAFLTDREEEGGLNWRERSQGMPRTERIGNILRGLDVAHIVTGSSAPQVAYASLADPGSAPGKGNTIGVMQFDAADELWRRIDTGLWPELSYTDLKTADFNMDGHLDLVVALQGAGGILFLGDGKGGFTPHSRIEAIRGKAKLAVGDIDGDGRPDIAASAGGIKNGPSGVVRAFLNVEGSF